MTGVPADPQAIAAAFELSRLEPGFYDDPYPTWSALLEHAPVRTMADGGVLLVRHADLMQVYREPAASSDKRVEFAPKFGSGPLFEHHTTSLVFNDPPLHTRVRRLILGAVNQRAIARMEPAVEALVDRLLDAMAARMRTDGEVDLIAEFAAAIPIEVIGNLLGVPHAERGPLRQWSIDILGALEPVLSPQALERGNRAVADFAQYLRGLIAARRAAPRDPEEDVLTRLIQGEFDAAGEVERLSETELLHNCIFLLNAGHETTTNLIGNGVDLLLRFPGQLERLRAEPALLPSAIEEMLRFESPVQLGNRRLVAPASIAGREWVSGTRITLAIGAANRDPRAFSEPGLFDVGRRPNRQLAFGQGDHACAGMNVARMEGRIAIGRLLARFARLERGGAPERDRRVRFRGFRRLPVRVG